MEPSSLGLKGASSPLFATATTAASGGYREELLGQRPAGCECRPRHEADAGCRNPSGPAHRNRCDLAALNTRHLLRKPVCGLKAPLGLSRPPGTAVLSGSLLCGKREHIQHHVLFFHIPSVPGGKQLCRLQPALIAAPPSLFRHRIIAPLAEGVAPRDAPGPQQDAFDAPMGQDGLHGVVAAAGRKPAAAADPRAEGVLIHPDQRAQGLAAGKLNAVHAFGSGFALRAGGTVAGGGASGRFALSGSPAWANSFATMALSCQLFSRGVMPRATKTRS